MLPNFFFQGRQLNILKHDQYTGRYMMLLQEIENYNVLGLGVRGLGLGLG